MPPATEQRYHPTTSQTHEQRRDTAAEFVVPTYEQPEVTEFTPETQAEVPSQPTNEHQAYYQAAAPEVEAPQPTTPNYLQTKEGMRDTVANTAKLVMYARNARTHYYVR